MISSRTPKHTCQNGEQILCSPRKCTTSSSCCYTNSLVQIQMHLALWTCSPQCQPWILAPAPGVFSSVFSSRLSPGADPGPRAAGSELLFQLHPDEATILFCTGGCQPGSQAHWIPPSHGLQYQCRCLLFPYLLGAVPPHHPADTEC